ncbi:hypothetical protein H9Q72_010146 [Fusarium xylarioides]|uniref:Uncharacterized protein n=1 Tax=Fusarium xylarioides TaxID=221167 RepID=A0A9P7L222_9HYPO|nr:hypothetical protein H9Q70_005690 [Fusarium xylarioides]KAG5761752.1 hypothetical protein H9Q72_010146 [Fusarium xylarioides]KAG5780834.1 hypothetical protein H9Q73_005492 [Fusarium xylarioides]
MFQGHQNGDKTSEAHYIVLKLPSTGSDKVKNDTEPLKKNGDMPTGLPLYPLPEEIPTGQIKTAKDKGLTDSPDEEANEDGAQMTYGAALAVFSLIDSFYELGLDRKDKYEAQ